MKRSKKTICIFVQNNAAHDPRVSKEARIASEYGYNTIVIGIYDRTLPAIEKKALYTIVRAKIFIFDNLRNVYRKFKIGSKHNSGNLAPTGFTSQRPNIALRILWWFTSNFERLFRNIVFVVAAKRYSPDICHCSDLDTLLAGFVLNKIIGSKVVYDAHELYESQSPHSPKLWKEILLFLERRLARRVSIVIGVNEHIARTISERAKIRSYTEILNCPYHRHIDKPADDLCSVANGKIKVLFQGAYMPFRGLKELIESGQFIRDAVIILMGYGSMERELKRLVTRLKLGDKVFFLDPVPMDKLTEGAIGADVGIIPYLPVCANHLYCTPNKFFDYMHAGCAILASDLPELRRLVINNNIGDLFDANNPKDIANKINKLSENKEELFAMKERSRTLAKERYYWQKEGLKLVDVYDKLLGLKDE
ncbi:glycosyltransferase [Candidatus Omnitrophota bacterium]